jgi:integrase
MSAARKAAEEGIRPRMLWREAATKYLREHVHKASIRADAFHLEVLDRYIGDLPIDQVHDDTLALFKNERKAAGVKQKSINLALEVVRRILNLAARSWRHDLGNGRSLTWLETPPLITMQKVRDAARPYPLDWPEQRELIRHLPKHLADMVLFKVNTGTRDQEVCRLQWDWEVEVPELNTSVFIIPAYIWTEADEVGNDVQGLVKNREDRLVVLNRIAESVIESRRGIHDTFVFTYRGKPVARMHNTAWKRAWRDAGLPVCRQYTRGVHNLKHTFGRRLRAAGVPLETRKVLLGHTNGDITTHYSATELEELINATNSIFSSERSQSPTLTLLKTKARNKVDTKRTHEAVLVNG